MGYSGALSRTFQMPSLCFFCFFLCICHVSSYRSMQQQPHPSTNTDSSDRISLLSFKSVVSEDQTGSLASWNDSLHHCQWYGVSCGRRHPERVTGLDLNSLQLGGPLSPALGNLTFLKRMDLSNNGFYGQLPPEFRQLMRLQHLNLSINSLQGGIAEIVSHFSQHGRVANHSSMAYIGLAHNILSGSIPASIANLSSLYHLDLSINSLSGGIPPTIGNLFSLTKLNLEYNHLSEGIPPSLGKLSALRFLHLGFNDLSGDIPRSVWNLSSLETLDLDNNSLSGSLPSHVGHALPRLRFFSIAHCNLHGPIPPSLSNASALSVIQLHSNMFSGIVPPDLGNLKYLRALLLARNQLHALEPKDWSFLTALTNCTYLEIIELPTNNLGGMLPNSIANLSTTLQFLNLADNHIFGSLPAEIGNLAGLTDLLMSENLLMGTIPASIRLLSMLQVLSLSLNNFTGEIPSALGNLTQLDQLYLAFNDLTGIIPSSLGNCQHLNAINLRNNKLTGAIPKQVLANSSLSRFLDLHYNSLTGTIPSEVGSLENLEILDISDNKLSGDIPSSLGNCRVMGELYMGRNLFEGAIPSSFRALRGIQILDLSYNNLSGSIPAFLQNFQGLYSLDLSFNNFDGELPRGGVFDNASAISVLGNNKLCGGNQELHLQPCQLHETRKKHNSLSVVIISIVSAGLFLFLLFCLVAIRYLKHNARRKSLATTEIEGQHVKVSYADLIRVTNGFSASDLIGVGSFGSVYKGMLNEKSIVVKVFNLQQHGASKSFIAECEVLRNIRHRNLVKIITACSSVDFRGNDFKAMVFEFMTNGSLENWLHPKANEFVMPGRLNFTQRLSIAIDVASALDYLHHHGSTPVVHCDLKPSNILLDDDMTAHVSDFGLSRFLMKIASNSSPQSTSSIGLKGTIGYVAPEYGMANRVSTYGDVYSYGILLLEMFTGKRPTDESFKDGLSLRKCVEMALPERVKDVMDAYLLLEERITEANQHILLKCVALILGIGLQCSRELPVERTEMGVVVSELRKLKDTFLGSGIQSG